MYTTMPARAGQITRPAALHALGMVRGELSRTRALLGDLDPAEWLRATDCAGWSVRDVAAHMIGESEELCRPTLLARRIYAARRLAGPDGDGRSKAQIRDRADRSTEQLLAELAYWARKATLAAERVPGPLHRVRGSIFFPAARGAPENTIDHFIRVLMPREAWMHRTDIAIAAQRPVGVGAQDGEVVRQVIRDLAGTWSRPAVILDFSGPMGGRWSLGEGRPVAEVHSDPVSFVRLAAGRPGRQPVIDGDGGTAAELLATRVVSCPSPRSASPA